MMTAAACSTQHDGAYDKCLQEKLDHFDSA